MYRQVCIFMYVFVCMHVYVCICTRACKYTCVYAHVCMYVSLLVPLYLLDNKHFWIEFELELREHIKARNKLWLLSKTIDIKHKSALNISFT